MGQADFTFDLTDTPLGFLFWSYRSWVRQLIKGYKADQAKVAVKAARKQAAIDAAVLEDLRWRASRQEVAA